MATAITSLKHYVQNKSGLAWLGVAILGALSVYILINLFAAFNLPKIANSTPSSPTHIKTHSLAKISAMHLFGEFNANHLPATTLQLVLEGIALATGTQQNSRAIISSAGQSKVYQIGQTVPGGAVIKAINQQRVILENNHQLESLKLPIPQLNGDMYQATP